MSAPQTWEVRARFVAVNPPFQGRSFPIVLFPAVIGRGTECAVFLDAVSVSRQHAVVEEKDGRFRIRDLGSRNGIRLADQPVHEAVLNAGDVVAVGDIQLRFEPAPADNPADASENAAAQPAPARTVTGQDIVALAQSAPAADLSGSGPATAGTPETQPRVGLNLKMIAAVVATLVLVAAAGVFILGRAGPGKVVRAQWPAVMVKVGESRWIQIARWQYLKEGSDVWWTAEDESLHGDIRNLAIGDLPGPAGAANNPGGDGASDEIAGVEKYDVGEILITGKSVGETGLTLTMDDGSVLTMRIVVRGRLEDPLDSLLYGLYPAAERIAMARQFLENGVNIEKEKPYLAQQEYAKAKAVLTPLTDQEKGELYLQVVTRMANMKRVVDDRWNTLRGQISIEVADKNLGKAIDLLQQAVKLIPDTNDPRRQKAEGALRSLIRSQLETKD